MHSIDPIYSDTYRPGFIGFTYRDDSIFSKGVALFTRCEADKIIISHTFMVIDDKLIVEASIAEGVTYRNITDYFNDPHVVVVFKKPMGLNKNISDVMISKIESHIGCSYDLSLIGYFIERFILNKFGIRNILKRRSLFDSNDEYICSELVADAIAAVPRYGNIEPFNNAHPSQIDPMMLFRSSIFKEWKY